MDRARFTAVGLQQRAGYNDIRRSVSEGFANSLEGSFPDSLFDRLEFRCCLVE
jgi:hypothetical protein